MEDKSVLKGKRYLDLLDFESEIKDLADQYNVLYFLKHPLMKNDEFQAFHQKLQKINNIEYLQNENSYYLLAQPEIKMVAGISSSVLSESLYFGKEIRYFYKPVIEKKYSRIYKSMFRLSFWAKVFDVATVKEKELFIYDNYLRLRYSLFYGYKVFMGIDLDKKLSQRSSYDNLIALFYFLQALDKEKKYILYGYGSVGKLIYPHIKENLVGIIDKSLREKDTVDGIKVLKEQQLNGYKDATILVTPYIHKEAIKQSLKHCKNEVIFLQ